MALGWADAQEFKRRNDAFYEDYLAGRLDIDSTGLLVFTQDGRVAKALIGEDSPVEKEYLVRVRPLRPVPQGEPWLNGEAMRALHHGLELDGRRLPGAACSALGADQSLLEDSA